MERLSVKQGMMLLFVGLMSPMIRMLPGRLTAIAGANGWLGAVFALVPGVLLILMVCDLLRRPGTDLTDAVCRAFGETAGRVLCFVIGLWVVLLCSLLLRFFGERFLSTAYIGEPVQLFVTLLLTVVFYAAHKKISALVRAGQIFFWTFAAVLAAVFALTALNVDRRNLMPVTWEALPQTVQAAEPVLGVLSGGLCLTLLTRTMEREKGAAGKALLTLAGLLVVAAVLLLITVGNFGVSLLQRMQYPFFMLVKEVRIANVFERVESVVIALWMVTDFVLVTMMVRAAARSFGRTFDVEREESCVTPVLLMVLMGSALIVPDSFALESVSEKLVQPINLVVGFGLIPLIWGVTKVRNLLSKNK